MFESDSELLAWSLVAILLACVAGLGIWLVIQMGRHRRGVGAWRRHLRENRQRERHRLKDLAAAQHDLRQPIQAAGMFVSVLEQRLAGTPNAAIVQRLADCLDSTNTLITALLDHTVMDMGRMTVSLDRVALGPLLEQLAEQTRPQAQAKGLRLRLVDSHATVLSDPLLLQRMVRNLLVNAVTYTKTGGILMGCRHRPGAVGIQVVDTGIGIPQDRLSDVFDDFTRVNPAERATGLGLGLGVVSRAARLLGHSVTARSIPGKGSSFTVWIPLA